MSRLGEASYNDRLFGTGIRGRIHYARFHALKKAIARLDTVPESVIELGSFDGKTIRFLPRVPSTYLGLDADWEGGLTIGRAAWENTPGVRFERCVTPEDIPTSGAYDLAVCMETLEHVPPTDVERYLERLARVTRGFAFITVPNEKGLVFGFKYIAKRLFIGDAPDYTFGEFVSAVVGRMGAIERDEHKGFDYQTIVTAVGEHFDIVSVHPYPMSILPLWSGFGVAILARSRGSAGA